MLVIKADGSTVKFDANKIRKWIAWGLSQAPDIPASEVLTIEYRVLQEVIARLPERVRTEEIHQVVINVCLDQEELMYSRIAAELEKASIYKNLSREGFINPQGADFTELYNFFVRKGVWAPFLEGLNQGQLEEINENYIELEALDLEYWVLKQFSDKYSQKLNGKEVETPAMAALAIALTFHGFSELAFDVANDICTYKANYPTPVLNGVRNGNFDSISCCLIEGGDSVASNAVAEYLAGAMTAKKAGIGLFTNTRSKGDPVKKGAVKHLGKAPLFRTAEKVVKNYTQITRGGSATLTIRANDPEILSLLLLKTQRIDIAQRVDKVDYSFAYNDEFIRAVLNKGDWYLFSRYWAPEVHENYHATNYLDYVKAALEAGRPHQKVKALDVLKAFLSSRFETGRVYCINVTRMNTHTPFLDPIQQSNLCLEIALPTKPWVSLEDLTRKDGKHKGEVAFCAIAAVNVAATPLQDYFAVAERTLRTVDRMIELAPGLHEALARDLKKRRSVGIGITGLAGYLYEKGLDYDGSYESLVEVEQLGATHYYALLSASQKMSRESGFEVEGVDLNWLPIDTAKWVTDPQDWDLEYDWEALRNKPRKHSVLVAHMPCESSSAFSNSTNGLYPSRKKVIYKAARTGRVQFISPGFDPDKHKAVWDINMAPYYAAIQNTTDQQVSADYYTDFTKYPNKKIPEHEAIKWFLEQAILGNKSVYYQVFRDNVFKSANEEPVVVPIAAEEDADCESCKL
jgi:ribonucleoside-diphosphate reductase alpha chain